LTTERFPLLLVQPALLCVQRGDRVLLRTKELLDAADMGKLRPRGDGPVTVTA
jgi:hypothetical protein